VKVKQSLCYGLYRPKGMSLDEFCRTVKAIGYPAIELWFRDEEFEELCAAAGKHKLVIASMCGHKSLPDGLNKRSNHERIEQELRESIDLAAKCGIGGLICFSGNRQPHMSELEAIDACADGLKRIAPYAQKKGINLNMELLNSKVDHGGYQCDHTAWGVAVCQKVGSPAAKLLYDIYHMQIMEGDVIRNIRENIRYIGHFHTAGNPGRGEMFADQELNYVGICQAIAAAGYQHYLGHEYKPAGDPIESLRRTFELCNQG